MDWSAWAGAYEIWLRRRVLASADLRDIAGCWEFSLLPAKAAEWPAFRLNAADALDLY